MRPSIRYFVVCVCVAFCTAGDAFFGLTVQELRFSMQHLGPAARCLEVPVAQSPKPYSTLPYPTLPDPTGLLD